MEANYRRSFSTAAIDKLSTTSITEALSAPGLAAYASFRSSYKGALDVRGTDYANSPAFKNIVASYRSTASDALERAKSAKRYPEVANINIENVLNSNANLFFSYALSEFLVANDLSAVVVVPTPTGDHHDFNDSHYVNMCLTYTCFRQLILNLEVTADNTRSGKSVLDCTTICLETEFDRTYNCSSLSPSTLARPGTNHGSSTSVIFAGARIPGGRIIGDIKTGASGLYSAYADEPFANPLPIDPVSGVPSKDGIFFSQRALLPTLLAMFGIQVPAEQVSDQQTLAALIKC